MAIIDPWHLPIATNSNFKICKLKIKKTNLYSNGSNE